MSNTIEIAVIIPTFRRRETLQRALESVRAQTFPPAEIIVVDDCSGPEYEPLLASLPDFIRVVRLPANRGPGASRNVGVEVAASPFVAFLDSDDWWQPTKLERQVALLHENSTTDAVHTAVQIARGDELRNATCRKPMRLDTRSILERRAVITSSLLVRKDAFTACGGFDERIQSSEDYDLSIRLVASGARVDFLPEYLTVLRRDRADHVSAQWRRVLRGQWQVAWKHRRLLVAEFGVGGFFAKLVTDAHHAAFKARTATARALRIVLTPFVSSRFGDPPDMDVPDGLTPVRRSRL